MRVAVIGAGPSGLTAAKHLKEAGLVPTVFESAGSIGGIWRPQSHKTWHSLKLNLSRHTCVFSDFPWAPTAPEFPCASAMGAYLGEYASYFGLEPCIKLNARVHQVRPTADARWSVRWRGQEEEEEGEGTFDRLVLASGFFGPASLPTGLDTAAFRDNPRNILMHSMDYRDPTPFKGRSVLVLGSAFSGVEVASEV
jgi:dimethylaniline monooxygenase (N-oxide forming)